MWLQNLMRICSVIVAKRNSVLLYQGVCVDEKYSTVIGRHMDICGLDVNGSALDPHLINISNVLQMHMRCCTVVFRPVHQASGQG